MRTLLRTRQITFADLGRFHYVVGRPNEILRLLCRLIVARDSIFSVGLFSKRRKFRIAARKLRLATVGCDDERHGHGEGRSG